MGTDLLLVEPQLCLPQIFLLLGIFLLQPPDPLTHMIKSTGQYIDLL